MLREETVVSSMLDIIKEFQSDPIFQNFYLAGGTALALQLGHRTSTDIDLFNYKEDNFSKINEYLKRNNDKYAIDTTQDDFSRIYRNNVKIEFVRDIYGKLIRPPLNENGIVYLDKTEIAPMKLFANMGRKRARDIIDIAFLLQEMSLENMFDLYKEKYGPFNVNILKRELINKSKILNEDKNLSGIKIIRNDIKIEDIPILIKKAIDEYNNKLGIGNIKESTKYYDLDNETKYK